MKERARVTGKTPSAAGAVATPTGPPCQLRRSDIRRASAGRRTKGCRKRIGVTLTCAGILWMVSRGEAGEWMSKARIVDLGEGKGLYEYRNDFSDDSILSDCTEKTSGAVWQEKWRRFMLVPGRGKLALCVQTGYPLAEDMRLIATFLPQKPDRAKLEVAVGIPGRTRKVISVNVDSGEKREIVMPGTRGERTFNVRIRNAGASDDDGVIYLSSSYVPFQGIALKGALDTSQPRGQVARDKASVVKTLAVQKAPQERIPVAEIERQIQDAEREIAAIRIPEENVRETIHVNIETPVASDDAEGTAARPLKTIGKAVARAVELNARNAGVRILVWPGTYRESLLLDDHPRKTDAPIVVEAKERGEAVVSGSDVWSDWQRDGRQPHLFTHAWPYKWGLGEKPWTEFNVSIRPIVRRREMIFVNGESLQQVLDRSALKEGTFLVAEEEEKVYVWPPRGANLAAAKVEVAVRGELFLVRMRKNVVVRGFTFQHSNDRVATTGPVDFSGCSNVLIEDCCFAWNNWAGFSGFHGCHHVIARRLVADHNGGEGMSGWRIKHALFEDLEASHNNLRGAAGGYLGWSVAGYKWLVVHDSVFRRNKATQNLTRGLWFDTDCARVLIEEAFLCENKTNGIMLEANQGPFVLRGCVINKNGRWGVYGPTTENVVLDDNVVMNNGHSQLYVVGGGAGRPVTDYETGLKYALHSVNWTLTNNVVVGTAKDQYLLRSSTDRLFPASYRGHKNLWYHPTLEDPFEVMKVALDLAAWQAVTGQDADSMFADPGYGNPAEYDFALTAVSPLHRRGGWRARRIQRQDIAALLEKRQKDLFAENWNNDYALAQQASAGEWLPLDLRALANRPVQGEDGWIGIMPLQHFPTGTKTIQGVRFQFVNPAQNGDMALIALRSTQIKRTRGRDVPSRVIVPFGKKARALYFLHGCGWASRHEKVGEYRLLFQDGSEESLAIVPLAGGSEHTDVMLRMIEKSNIQDWIRGVEHFNTDHAKSVMITDPDNPMVSLGYLYSVEWKNPKPNLGIVEIQLVSDPSSPTSIFVAAITALQYRGGVHCSSDLSGRIHASDAIFRRRKEAQGHP